VHFKFSSINYESGAGTGYFGFLPKAGQPQCVEHYTVR